MDKNTKISNEPMFQEDDRLTESELRMPKEKRISDEELDRLIANKRKPPTKTAITSSDTTAIHV